MIWSTGVFWEVYMNFHKSSHFIPRFRNINAFEYLVSINMILYKNIWHFILIKFTYFNLFNGVRWLNRFSASSPIKSSHVIGEWWCSYYITEWYLVTIQQYNNKESNSNTCNSSYNLPCKSYISKLQVECQVNKII